MNKINLACIIDDDPIYIFGTKRIMQMADFCKGFLVYNDGQAALNGLKEIFESKKAIPDIILLDLNMPIMDGWEFLDEFTKIPNSKEINVFIVSSSINSEDSNKAKSYESVSNYVVKPISEEALLNMTKEMI